MKTYYVNKNTQSNGDHEVHEESCRFLPHVANRLFLGEFANCRGALVAAKRHYDQVDGCSICSKECHTQ
ncbi:MAG: hypothetical protein WBA74_18815 [Cyclobacteriaceae bacterium]